ncbi:glycosyltransferase family 2 protein [Paragemmobacter aquarius]|uniref:glycosyltransferase family 2 protein n=1 Tax=Paragemmobacter aquarius TaxID=2169400 RepID=UPI00131F3826|nr:glycosyltransferase [Gemmobacter aquarius]
MNISTGPSALHSGPRFSFIVCTRDRPAKTLACLRSIAATVGPAPGEAEIILVENGSQKSLSLPDAELDEAAPGLCRTFRLAKGCLSEARNLACDAAQGEFVVYIDDDCMLQSGYLDDLKRHVGRMEAEGQRHYIIGGRVMLGDPSDLPFTIKDHPQAQTFHTGIHPGGFVQGCNFFLPKATAALIGGFDPRFGPGARFHAGEDTDYLIRAHAAGVPLHYVPDMAVWHCHGRRTFDEVDRLNRTYAFANGAILAKHLRDHPWLARHLAWTIRSTAKERIGGPHFDDDLGLSWGSVTTSQLRGVWAFIADRMRHGRMAL